MKQFNNLLEAISFNTHCPLCQGDMRSSSFTNSNKKVALKLLNVSDDAIHIDIATQNIEVMNSNKLDKKPSKGILGQPITISCFDCYMYSFIIQIWIDLKNYSINKILLNSEEVGWEDDDHVLHEVVSIYSTNKTKYSYYSPDTAKDDGQIVLPFIPIDVSNPKDAVIRIQKLIVFS